MNRSRSPGGDVPSPAPKSKAVFFASPAEFREWLSKNASTCSELTLGFYKKGSGRICMTYAEALDEALCHGWIDGLRKGVDEALYTIRFTPRQPGSIWSRVNTQRVEHLSAAGLMRKEGLEAFDRRNSARMGIYSYENPARAFSPVDEEIFKTRADAWKFFQAQAAWYKRAATWWVVSAKRAATRQRRMDQLIKDSENRRRLARLSPASAPKTREK